MTLCVESFPDAALRGPDGVCDGLPWRCVSVASVDPMILLAIRRQEVNLAIWIRERPAELDAVSLWPMISAGPFVLTAEGPPQFLAAQLTSGDLPTRTPPALLRDVNELATVFAVLGACEVVRVRLEVATSRTCPRWHVDDVGLRLLCTYWGPGTEWLAADGGAEAAQKILTMPSPPESSRLSTGSVAIFKGERYPANRGAGCIHRSPQAGPGAAARLTLSIEHREDDHLDGNC